MNKQFFIPAVSLGLMTALAACKAPSVSRLRDAATTTSFKTGSFIPKTESEFEVADTVQPISTKEFIDRARKITGKEDLLLAYHPAIVPSVVASGSGEQLLVTASASDIPTPQISIASGKVYAWHQLILGNKKELALTDLFVRRPYGEKIGKYQPADMYVRRMASTSDGTKEPLLVPWLSHVKSETSNLIIYQAGNSILDAHSGLPIMEFHRIKNKPIWYVSGNYADKDVSANTVFWKLNSGSYRSYTPGQDFVTIWEKQDDDSIDRVSTKPKAQEEIPTLAQEFLASVSKNAKSLESKRALRSFDPFKGDRRIFQLQRSKIFRKFSSGQRSSSQQSSSQFSLMGFFSTPAAPRDEELTAEDFKPLKQGFNLDWFSGQTPLRVNEVPGGFKQANWNDSDGTPQAGIVLSQRNVFQPGGWLTREKYVEQTTVKSPDGMVREVDQYGNVLSSMTTDEYRARAETRINIDRMQREGGVDGSVMRQSNQLANVSSYQLQRSESLLPGDSVGEMGQNLAVNYGVGQVKAQVNYGWTAPVAVVGTGVVSGVGSGVVKDYFKGSDEEKMFWNGGENVLKEGTKSAGKAGVEFLKSSPDYASTGQAVSGYLPAVGAAVDTGFEAYKRRNDFSPSTSPDYYFDSQTSTAALAVPAVSTLAAETVTYGIPKSRARDAYKQGIKDTVDSYGKTTESYARATRAETIEWERTNVLEDSLQRNRDARSAEEGLSTLEELSD